MIQKYTISLLYIEFHLHKISLVVPPLCRFSVCTLGAAIKSFALSM